MDSDLNESGGPLWKLAGARAETLGLLKDRYTSRADPDAPATPNRIPSDAILDASMVSSTPSERRPSLWCVSMLGVLVGWLANFFVSSSCCLVHKSDSTYGLWKYSNLASTCVAYRNAGVLIVVARTWHAAAWLGSTVALAAAWWHLIQGGSLPAVAEKIALIAAVCEGAVALTLFGRGWPSMSILWIAMSSVVWMVLSVELRRTRKDVEQEQRRDDVELATAKYYNPPRIVRASS